VSQTSVTGACHVQHGVNVGVMVESTYRQHEPRGIGALWDTLVIGTLLHLNCFSALYKHLVNY